MAYGGSAQNEGCEAEGYRMNAVLLVSILILVLGMAGEAAAERHMMQPRVPADKLEEARAQTDPLPDAPDNIEKGKALYNGKGACFNCHGQDGGGNGPVSPGLDPAPRNFRHHGFWRHRTEGELFWVIKHGSPGTAMIGFGAELSDEEIWTVIRYERTFAEGHGAMRGMDVPRMGQGGHGAGTNTCKEEFCGR